MRQEEKPQAEGSLHFPVYSINNEVQWAFSLSFLDDVKEKKLKLRAHCTALFIQYTVKYNELSA